MVRRLTVPAILLLMLACLTSSLQAGELKVEPDRTRLYEGEVLTLTVTGTMKLDIDLTNLFEFDLAKLPAPDIDKLTPDFDILARNQNYSIRTVNGKMMSEITWTYQLAPKKTGRLTIPSLKFQDSTSDPVTVEVVPGTAPDQPASRRASFIELSADKAELYVQEQLILTVRLFFSGNLIRGELSEPEHPDAIIESLGKQQEYSRYRDGRRYQVVERRYALFPQKPGTFTLPPIRFQGQAYDDAGRLTSLQDSEQLFDIPVLDVPAGFTGAVWLPASDLTLEESGLPSGDTVDAGQNLTRKLTLKASGLPAEALPPLPDTTPDGLRSYPDNPERASTVTATGLESTLTQSTALVPVRPGQMTLPEIRIPWWDTDTDTQKFATLPARTLNVTGAAPARASTPPQPLAAEPAKTTSTTVPAGDPEPDNSLWPWLSFTLLVLWLLTLLAWWWSRQRLAARAPAPEPEHTGESELFDELVEAARKGSAATPALLARWANLRFPGHRIQTSSDALAVLGDPELQTELEKLQKCLFSPKPETEKDWNGRKLAEALGRVRKHKSRKTSEAGLPPLYPEKSRSL